jgi:hypothetical protein
MKGACELGDFQRSSCPTIQTTSGDGLGRLMVGTSPTIVRNKPWFGHHQSNGRMGVVGREPTFDLKRQRADTFLPISLIQ